MPASPADVHLPPHPLPALTTYELARYRRQLETAIASTERACAAAPALAGLRTALAGVTAEQDDRARIAARNA